MRQVIWLSDMHASPFEHIARPMNQDEFELANDLWDIMVSQGKQDVFNNPYYFANFDGWVPYRRELGI